MTALACHPRPNLEEAEARDSDADEAQGSLLAQGVRTLAHLLQAVLGGEIERFVIDQLAQGALALAEALRHRAQPAQRLPCLGVEGLVPDQLAQAAFAAID